MHKISSFLKSYNSLRKTNPNLPMQWKTKSPQKKLENFTSNYKDTASITLKEAWHFKVEILKKVFLLNLSNKLITSFLQWFGEAMLVWCQWSQTWHDVPFLNLKSMQMAFEIIVRAKSFVLLFVLLVLILNVVKDP